VLNDWRFARIDLAHGEYVLALEEINGTYVRFGRAPPAEAMPLIHQLVEMMDLNADSSIRSFLANHVDRLG